MKIFEDEGIPFNPAYITGQVDSYDRLSIEDLKCCDDNGGTIMNHTHIHKNITTLTEEELDVVNQ